MNARATCSTPAVAKIRQQANVGVMGDARFADEMFCHAVVAAIAARREIPHVGRQTAIQADPQVRRDCRS